MRRNDKRVLARETPPKRLYLIPVLGKALDILELLQKGDGPLTLESIHKSTRVSKTTVYRILKTLAHRGYAAQTVDGAYVPTAQPRKLRFGFGGQSMEMPFSVAVTESLRKAAAAVGVDLLVLDNRYDMEAAIENAELFLRERVDVVIEFQVEERAAPVIADKIAGAGIPLIAIDIPHPRSTYFGIDNYRAGFEAGRLLAEHAVAHWKGRVDWVVGLDLAEAGPLVQSRLTGSFEAIKTHTPPLQVGSFQRLDGRGMRDVGMKLMKKFLQQHPKDKRILVAAANDTSALGAIAAARELGREHHLAVVGHDCVEEMMRELGRRNSAAVGSISHEVSQYGPRLVELALSLLRGETVAPYNYVGHRAVVRSRGADARSR